MGDDRMRPGLGGTRATPASELSAQQKSEVEVFKQKAQHVCVGFVMCSTYVAVIFTIFERYRIWS